MNIQAHLLSLLIWVPILGGALVLALGNERPQAARWTSLAVSMAALLLCVPLYQDFSDATAAMQFIERAAGSRPWIRSSTWASMGYRCR